MEFEIVERDWTRQQLQSVKDALAAHPSSKSYILDELSVLDLFKMSIVADYDMLLEFKPRNRIADIPDTLPDGW